MCGILPNVLKTSKIIPFHKKELSFLNYQPISLLSNIDEILERIMYNRLYIFLEKNEFIFFLQFGFRWRHSATYALLIHLTELIKNELGDVNYGRGIFFDSQKTFDTVDHDILLKKLERYGIRGISYKWLASDLTNRNPFVSIHWFNLDLANTTCGVPQTSILGPLLFLVYINDFHSAIKYCK